MVEQQPGLLKHRLIKDKLMKYLYLDQNIWIYLCQAYYGKKENQIHNQILEKITMLIQKKKLIVPINLSNVVEVHKITNKKRRE